MKCRKEQRDGRSDKEEGATRRKKQQGGRSDKEERVRVKKRIKNEKFA